MVNMRFMILPGLATLALAAAIPAGAQTQPSRPTIAGIVGVLLIAYLFVSVFKPEKF